MDTSQIFNERRVMAQKIVGLMHFLFISVKIYPICYRYIKIEPTKPRISILDKTNIYEYWGFTKWMHNYRKKFFIKKVVT